MTILDIPIYSTHPQRLDTVEACPVDPVGISIYYTTQKQKCLELQP
jgi:hypothetical protein